MSFLTGESLETLPTDPLFFYYKRVSGRRSSLMLCLLTLYTIKGNKKIS